MHDEYQEDDIYNEAARRLGQGDIVSGKDALKKYTRKTLNEITILKRVYIPFSIVFGFIFSLSLAAIAANYAQNKPERISNEPILAIFIVSFVLCLVCFNFGRIAQYFLPLSRRLLSEYRNIPPEIESLFRDLRNGSWEASIGGVQMPSYLLDSPWRMLLVGGADVRERRYELWCLFRPKFHGDIRVRKVPGGVGLPKSSDVAPDGVARENHGATENGDTSLELVPCSARATQLNKLNTRENRLLREFESIPPEQCEDLIEDLCLFYSNRRLKRARIWPGENRGKWLVIFQTCHKVATSTGIVDHTGGRLIYEGIAALNQAKAASRIEEVGLTAGSKSTDWVKSFVHDEKSYGWIHNGIIEFNRARQTN